MSDRALRDRWIREVRLEESVPHCLRLSEFIGQLREEPTYPRNGHGGVLLLRTPELRIVLETMRKDAVIHEHAVHGPVFVYVLESELELRIDGRTLTAGCGELLALPRDQRRMLRARDATSLLWVIARAPAGAVEPA
jgi:quercetin dioxygenase-like cupin family protein